MFLVAHVGAVARVFSPRNRTQLEKINDEIINDPTLQRDLTAECPECRPGPGDKKFGAVFFQANSASTSDERMAMIFVCCNPECLHKWQA